MDIIFSFFDLIINDLVVLVTIMIILIACLADLLTNPVARPMIEALDYAQRTNTIGSLRNEDVSRSIRANDSMVRMAESDGSSALMVAAVAQNAEVMAALNERLKRPIDAAVSIAGEHGFVEAKNEYDRYLRNKSPKDY